MPVPSALPTVTSSTVASSTWANLVKSWVDYLYTAASGGAGASQTITQTAHGLAVQKVIRYASGAYSVAQANSLTNCEAIVGIVTAVADANTFTVQQSGWVTGLSDLTANTVYYLSASASGDLTNAAPAASSTNQNIPLLIATSTTTGIIIPPRFRPALLALTEGGTGATTASGARTNLGLVIGTDVQAYHATLAAVVAGTYTGAASIVTLGTIVTGVWNGTAIAVANGGTGATSAADARTNLGLAIGTNVQAFSATLAAIAAGTWTGAASITTLGTITTGVWQGTAVGATYLPKLNGITAPDGSVSLNSQLITNLAAPVSGTDAARLQTFATFPFCHGTVNSATSSALAACTYDNGTAGVGATLTKNSAGALGTISGVAMTAGMRLLVNNQASAFQNGVYDVTNAGSGGAAWVLTRALDADQTTELIPGTAFRVLEGDFPGKVFVQSSDVPVIGTDDITYILDSNSLIDPAVESVGDILTLDANKRPVWSAPTAGASTALDNLASVAINTTLIPGTSDGAALGSGTKMWSDLFLAAGGVINFNNSGLTLTESSDKILWVGSADVATFGSPYNYSLDMRSDNTAGQNVGPGISFGGKYSSGGSSTIWAMLSSNKENATDNNFAGNLVFSTRPAGGSMTERLNISSTGAFDFKGGAVSNFNFSSAAVDNAPARWSFVANDTTALAANTGGGLGMGGVYSSGGDVTQFGYIAAKKENATDGNYAGYISIGTRQNGAGFTEDLRISSAGLFGFGTSGPENKVDINSATGACLQLTYNDSNGSAANKVNFAVSSSGDLNVTPSGGDVTVTGNLNVTGTITGVYPGDNFMISAAPRHDGTSSWTDVSGTWVFSSSDPNHLLGGALNVATPALNNEVKKTHVRVPTSGTYAARICAARADSQGIAELFFGGASKGTFDFYNATLQYNYWSDPISLGSLTAGTGYELAIKMGSKNASSSDYGLNLQMVEIYRTA